MPKRLRLSSRGDSRPQTAQRLYDEADLNRAIQAYKFFYPNISMVGLAAPFEGFSPVNNKSFFILSGSPKQILFTPNSVRRSRSSASQLKSKPKPSKQSSGSSLVALSGRRFATSC